MNFTFNLIIFYTILYIIQKYKVKLSQKFRNKYFFYFTLTLINF